MAGVVVAPRLMAGRVEELQDGKRPQGKGRGEGTERGVLGAPVDADLRQGKAPRSERQKGGRGGAGRGRRLERRLCDGGAGPQRRKRSMMLTFQGLLWLVGKASRQGAGREKGGAGREKGVPSFPFALHMSWLLRQVLLTVDGFLREGEGRKG
jgi:hypothetical protein